MAEALFRELVQDTADEEWRIGSAGTWAAEGQPPMPGAVQSLDARGIDVRGHRSRSVDHVPLEDYALILVMEQGHKESLTWEFPSIAYRVFLITELTGEARDVADPVTGTLQDHVHTLDALERTLVDGLPRIRVLSRESQSFDSADAA